MQTSKFRNCFRISGRKIIISCVLLCCSLLTHAQQEHMNNAEHDDKPYYFGITLGFNAAQFKVSQSKYLTDYDTIMNITPLWRPGFQLGIMGNLRLSKFIDIRTIPSFVLREKALAFAMPKDSVLTSSFESILFSMPVELKFKSDRQNNFRFYVCAGAKIDYDFNANNHSRRENELIRVKPLDYGYNLGLGFEFYFSNFIFAPEIKISNGLGNSLDRNSDEPTNKAIEKLSTRMLIIGFHIEG
ncbi:MAG: hypothetical protein RIQ62_260 [Bacteroidota bacterium]